jgi:hypothetical protein
MPQRGDKICIGGRTYEFVPAVELTGLAAGQDIPGYLSDVGLAESVEESTAYDTTTVTGLLSLIQGAVEETRKSVVDFYNYVGVYRSLKQTIPKDFSNFEINFGFPVRQFYFDTPALLTVRLNSPTADPIDVDSASSPFALNDLPNKLAFTKIYVTNANPVDIVPYIFVMG